MLICHGPCGPDGRRRANRRGCEGAGGREEKSSTGNQRSNHRNGGKENARDQDDRGSREGNEGGPRQGGRRCNPEGTGIFLSSVSMIAALISSGTFLSPSSCPFTPPAVRPTPTVGSAGTVTNEHS